MRLALSLALLLILAPLRADRLLRLPLANSLYEGQWVVEDLYSTRTHSHTGFLQIGLPSFFEAGVLAEKGRVGANIQYSFVQPFPEYSPGLAVGVLDIANQTDAGRAVWVAVTWQYNVYADWADRERISFTLGGGTAPRFKGAFLALDVPVYTGWSLLMEHDSRTLTVGAEYSPSKNIRVRALIADGRAGYSLGFRFGF
ncbi:MAG: hypothetical protein KatS3mg015_1564 [Fimbriimonadales bacterium]|nr:MAG: hypothetical protein KatS3mg015_1564 [Fimbriimonadales bacterium]